MASKKVAVLGLGFEGLFAAKAAKDCGCEVTCYTDLRLTPSWFWSYWFSWIPEDLQEQFELYPIFKSGTGTARGYQSLQWGRVPAGFTFNDFPEKNAFIYGYNAKDVLAKLFIPAQVLEIMFTEQEIESLTEEFDLIFQTFPTDLSKETQSELLPFIVAQREEPEQEQNYVVYNGRNEGIIARELHLWGREYLEFPKYLPLQEIQKVMSLENYQIREMWELSPFTKLWCQPVDACANLHLVGRWAEWNFERTVPEVYTIVKEIIENG